MAMMVLLIIDDTVCAENSKEDKEQRRIDSIGQRSGQRWRRCGEEGKKPGVSAIFLRGQPGCVFLYPPLKRARHSSMLLAEKG